MTEQAAVRPFDMGRVIQRTFGVTGRNLASFGLLALVFVGAPSVAAAWLQQWAIQQGTDAAMGALASGGVITFLVSFVLGLLLQAALVYGTVSDLNGRRAGFGECLSVAFRRFFTVLGIAIMFVLAIMAAALLLIIPGTFAGVGAAGAVVLATLLLIVLGLFLTTVWCVAVPVTVVERRGVFGSFSRSAALTRGARWLILALLLIYGVAAMVFTLVVMIIGGLAAAPFGGNLLVFGLVNAVGSVVSALIGSVGAAAIYVELRERREGLTPQDLASVFA